MLLAGDGRGNPGMNTDVAAEVEAYLLAVMREGGAGAMKAAELLGRRYGLFDERPEAVPTPVIVDDLGPEAQP